MEIRNSILGIARHIAGFNGATSFQKWKSEVIQSDTLGTKKVSMEPLLFRNGNTTAVFTTLGEMVLRVSMEPLLFRNGNDQGATLVFMDTSTWVSMEPLLFRNGNKP